MKSKYTKQISKLLAMLSLALAVSLSSCIKGEDTSNTKQNNFEQLWKIIDERYCFFEYKEKELGIDWNEIHDRYAAQINGKMDSQQLFEVCCNMLSELKDGHVNLGAGFDLGREWSYFQNYPENYNDSIVQAVYLTNSYKIASGLRYRILEDNIAYVRYESFSDGVGSGNITYMMDDVASCAGIIIDVRNNGGGDLTNAHTLASHFVNEKTLIGYYSHKTGKGHYDLSAPVAEYLEPASDGLRWQKPVVVLTNRRCYSATNDFVKCMKAAPLCTIMGDKTGGGSGLPFSSELPCGWSIRYSAVIYYDRDMNHTEFGIEPDIQVEMSGTDTDKKRDTFIEKAKEYIKLGPSCFCTVIASD